MLIVIYIALGVILAKLAGGMIVGYLNHRERMKWMRYDARVRSGGPLPERWKDL